MERGRDEAGGDHRQYSVEPSDNKDLLSEDNRVLARKIKHPEIMGCFIYCVANSVLVDLELPIDGGRVKKLSLIVRRKRRRRDIKRIGPGCAGKGAGGLSCNFVKNILKLFHN